MQRIGPIFVLGSPRSGTTAMSSSIAHATDFKMKGEGHVWPLLLHLESILERYSIGVLNYAGIAADLDLAYFLKNIREKLPRIFIDNYELNSTEWIDKTPGAEMIEIAPRLLDFYPNAKFILMKRHPIESISSMIRRFPDRTFQVHCINWASTYLAWIKIKPFLGSSALEVDQLDLLKYPLEVANNVAAHIGMSEFSYKLYRYFCDRHIERTAIDNDRTPSIFDTNWNNTEIYDFVEICEDISSIMNYSVRDTFYKDIDDSISLFFPRTETLSSFITNRNDYTYPIKGGFQLCPNATNLHPLTISYRQINIPANASLLFGCAREFSYGPDISVQVEVRRANDDAIILIQDVPVRTIEAYDTYLPLGCEADCINIDIRLIIPGGVAPDYGTVFMYRPIITSNTPRLCQNGSIVVDDRALM